MCTWGISNCSLLETLSSLGPQDTTILLLRLPPSRHFLKTDIPLSSVRSCVLPLRLLTWWWAHPPETSVPSSHAWLPNISQCRLHPKSEIIANHWLDMIKARNLGANAGPSFLMAVRSAVDLLMLSWIREPFRALLHYVIHIASPAPWMPVTGFPLASLVLILVPIPPSRLIPQTEFLNKNLLSVNDSKSSHNISLLTAEFLKLRLLRDFL